MSSRGREPRQSTRAAIAPRGVRERPDPGLGDVVLPIRAAPEQLVDLLDDSIAAMEVVPADEVVEVLRRAPPLGWGHWVARQVELGNLEMRVSRGHLYSEVEDADEVDWVPGEYLAGSLLFLGRGIAFLDPVCRADPKLIEHEGIHYFDEGYEIATGRRISGVETELHAFFRGEVFELRCERVNQERSPWLWPRKLHRIRRRLRSDIAQDGYYGVTSDVSMIEDAEEHWLSAYARSASFPLRGALRSEIARGMLGLDKPEVARFSDGLRRPPGGSASLAEATGRLELDGPIFRPYDEAEMRRIWQTRLARYVGELSNQPPPDDRWPGLDAFPEKEQDRSLWAVRPCSSAELKKLIVEACGDEGARRVALDMAQAALETVEDPERRRKLCEVIADIRDSNEA